MLFCHGAYEYGSYCLCHLILVIRRRGLGYFCHCRDKETEAYAVSSCYILMLVSIACVPATPSALRIESKTR